MQKAKGLQLFALFMVFTCAFEPVLTLSDDLTEDMICTACLAMVEVFDHHLTSKSDVGTEVKFFNALDSLCDMENFKKFDYIPPKMVKACQYILDENNDEDLEKEMLRYYKNGKAEPSKKEVEFFVCTMWSRACINVKRNKPQGLPVPDEELYGETIKRMMDEQTSKRPKPSKYTPPEDMPILEEPADLSGDGAEAPADGEEVVDNVEEVKADVVKDEL